MKLSLSAKWFLWLAGSVAVFSLLQLVGMIWLEFDEVLQGEETLNTELGEILALGSVSVCVFVFMLVLFWFVSRKMIEPLHTIADTAQRINAGDLAERVKGEGSADEIDSLASTLNSAFDRYREVIERLERFAGNTAHQLRTPLSSIRSIGEVCLQKDRSAGEYRDCIGEILEVAQELAATVEKLLAVARLDPARVRRQFGPVELSDVVSQAIEVYRVMFEEKGIEVDVTDVARVTVEGDTDLLGQAVRCIMENAIQFTPAGGTVRVCLQHGGDRASLRISDSGPGMPESVRRHIGQGTGRTRHGALPAGRMGLSIVSEIMKIHNGTVHIEPHECGGTCVKLGWSSKVACPPV